MAGKVRRICENCATHFYAREDHVRAGGGRFCSKSCAQSGRFNAHFKHGHAVDCRATAEYAAWVSMRARCRDANHPFFYRYGGRGITVCEAWNDNFTAFLKDLGKRPGPAFTLGRINNARGYEPGNVEWQTRREQSNNICTNRCIALNGQRMTTAQATKECGIRDGTARMRMSYGWGIYWALLAPSNRRLLCQG